MVMATDISPGVMRCPVAVDMAQQFLMPSKIFKRWLNYG